MKKTIKMAEKKAKKDNFFTTLCSYKEVEPPKRFR